MAHYLALNICFCNVKFYLHHCIRILPSLLIIKQMRFFSFSYIRAQVGEAAVPINMTILGINLSSTFQKSKPHKTNNDDGNAKSKLLSNETMLAVVIGKMIVMPAIGIVSTWILQRYYIVLPDGMCTRFRIFLDTFVFTPTKQTHLMMLSLYNVKEIDATCYLVMMIVFITPTANNVMIMVELSGSSSKEGMARLIGWQYVVSPVLLR